MTQYVRSDCISYQETWRITKIEEDEDQTDWATSA
jgi:hypothetical protein